MKKIYTLLVIPILALGFIVVPAAGAAPLPLNPPVAPTVPDSVAELQDVQLALSVSSAAIDPRTDFASEPKPAPVAVSWTGSYSGQISNDWLGYFPVYPVNPSSMLDGYGPRGGGFHGGIDFFPGYGSTIVSAGSGTVTVVDSHWSWGHMVKIEHGSGVSTLYAHMIPGSQMVYPGQWVEAGTPIGLVGETGEAYGAHLHFEVYVGSNKVNPLGFF